MKSKTKVALITVIGIIVAAIIGGIFFLHGVSGAPFVQLTPQQTLDAACDGWKTGNAAEVYAQWSTHLQAGVSVADIQRQIDTNNRLAGGVKTCTYGPVHVYGSTASTVLTVTLVNGQIVTEADALVLENGVWKIDSVSTTVTVSGKPW